MSSFNPSLSNISDFRTHLLAWYRLNRRELPWRYQQNAPPDPYKVWLSEIMLQQTTVTAVIPYFQKFIKKWPTLCDLAQSPQEEIIDMWAGLGYYSRARNLHKCARQVLQNHQSVFPNTEKELLTLAGIGPYTAAAILSIAYNKPANIVDGNVERFMARFFMLKKPLRDIKPLIKNKASVFVGDYEGDHSDYSQSLMELGALICTPQSPKCEQCPVHHYCESYANNFQNKIPTRISKENKPLRPQRHGHAYLIKNKKNEILVERREEKGLLANTIGIPTSQWVDHKKEKEHLPLYNKNDFKEIEERINHVFTHFELELSVYVSETLKIDQSNKYYWISEENLKRKLPTVFKKVYNSQEKLSPKK